MRLTKRQMSPKHTLCKRCRTLMHEHLKQHVAVLFYAKNQSFSASCALPVWLLRCALPVNNSFEACASPVQSDIITCAWVFSCDDLHVRREIPCVKTLVCMTLISMWRSLSFNTWILLLCVKFALFSP